MLNIVLVEPEIPSNTGNIMRTCAAIGAKLHLIEPLGFDLDEKQLKRAGMDYIEKIEIIRYKSFDEFRENNAGKGTFWYFSTKTEQNHTDAQYGENDYLIFGKESAGLPEYLIFGNPDNAVRIPMREDFRSLNLSNSVAIAAYEALRQLDFPDMF